MEAPWRAAGVRASGPVVDAGGSDDSRHTRAGGLGRSGDFGAEEGENRADQGDDPRGLALVDVQPERGQDADEGDDEADGQCGIGLDAVEQCGQRPARAGTALGVERCRASRCFPARTRATTARVSVPPVPAPFQQAPTTYRRGHG
jgi:hypothetical protein